MDKKERKRNFHLRYSNGKNIEANWVNKSDFKKT